MGFDVFISYSSKESQIAAKVCNYLELNNISCWIAPRNVNPGLSFAPQIVQAIKECKALILLASKSTNASGHVSSEVSFAFDQNKTIIPFRLEEFQFSDEYQYYLGRTHWINACDNFDAGLYTLLETVNNTLGKDMLQLEVSNIKSENIQKEYARETTILSKEFSRDEIVDLLFEKIEKFPYSLFKKFSSKEEYQKFKLLALQLFRETFVLYKQKKIIPIEDNFIENTIDIVSHGAENYIQVHGLPGCAKNMLLQLVYYEMLVRFKNHESDYLPIYISSSYYEKLPYDKSNIQKQMKEAISEEFQEFFEFLQQCPQVKPVLLMEAIREHIVARISPETIVFELWKSFGRYNRITTIDVGLIKNKSRLKRVIPITGDAKSYICTVHSIPIEDKRASLAAIDSIIKMYDYELEADNIYDVIKKLKFPFVDIFLVRLVAKEMLSSYEFSDILITDMYEKMALSELYGDSEKLFQVSKELFDYVFNDNYRIHISEYNGMVWSLPHKHNSYLEFSIAFYYMNRIRNYQEDTDYSFFRTMLTSTANKFMVAYLKEDYVLQEILLNFVVENYDSFDIQQKSNAAYWLGRITYKNLVNIAVGILSKEFARLKPLVKTNNKNIQENCDNHFLFRSVCMGLLLHGQANMMDEYLCIVVTNDIANAINRGVTIEYFGDNYQMAAHDAYYMDTDITTGEQAIKILGSRIEAALKGDSRKFVENNLVTMLTLLQARIQAKNKANMKFDIDPYVKNTLKYLKIYQNRPQNIVSGKLIYYFQSMQEDIEYYLQSKTFDIGPKIYNKYRNLKQVKRSQWVSHNIDDPESVSEHTFSTWMMAMLFLPEVTNDEGYNKKEILDMLLVHDLAEAELGDQILSFNEPTKDLKSQNDVLRKLFLKGTYPNIANLTYYYNVWTGYYNGININARTARDINLLQSVYTFCEYYCMYPEKFTKEEVREWLAEEMNLKTEVGYQLFEQLIRSNQEFAHLYEL